MSTTTIPASRHVKPNMKLSIALAEARFEGVPAYAVAAEAGISPALLSMITRGRMRASKETRRAIAQALGRAEHDLFPAV